MDSDLRGRTLADRYDVLELLGTGGMGAVYRAHDRELDELVALKVVKGAQQFGVLEQFRSEVKLARRVTHRNVARTFELGHADGITFCTMELIEGESLRARLAREGTLAISESAGIAVAVCEALVAAHAAGVIHRDIKPDNILLANDDRVVLADFGVAALNVAGAGGFSGTLEYMAPEQARGEAATPATDVYAVGLVLYEMLAGMRAFAGTMSELIVAKQDVERVTFELANIVRPGAVPAELATVVERATARDPGQRIATPADLARALAPWLDAAAAPAPPQARRSARGMQTVIVLAPARDVEERMWIADGVHEQLLRELMQVPRLRVWPRVEVGEVPEGAVVVRLSAGEALDVAIRRGVGVARAEGEDTIHLRLPLEVDAIGLAAETVARAVGDLLEREPGAGAEREAAELVLRARRRMRAEGFAAAQESVELATRAHRLQPDDPRIAAVLAMVRVRFGLGQGTEVQFQEARSLVEVALAGAPELPETHVAAACLEQQGGDPGIAAAHFRTAIARAPYLADGHEGLGRMLLEAGFLDDGMARLEDALAIAPDLANVRWEIARAHALEQNWLLHDRMVDELRVRNDLGFLRMRTAWWRGDLDEVRRIRDAMNARTAGRGFEPELIDRLYDTILDGGWLRNRDAIVGRATGNVSPSRRRCAFVAQLAADAAGTAGDLPTCEAMIELAVANGLYDLHWLDRCPTLHEARTTARGRRARVVVKERADAILDALYGDRSEGSDTIATG